MRRTSLLPVVFLLSCGGAGSTASFPDRPALITAQAEWCSTLAKLEAKGGTWEPLADCKKAVPTSSPAYLKAMTSCYASRVEGAGDAVLDRGAILAECHDEASLKVNADGALESDVIVARCERMEKCEKVTLVDCKTGIEKLETAQKAMLTTSYNPPALAEVADCLRSKSCSEDEEKVRDACYEGASQKLVWFPN
jgi:hypothetical protein